MQTNYKPFIRVVTNIRTEANQGRTRHCIQFVNAEGFWLWVERAYINKKENVEHI
jgi:hypothetical protein